MTTKANRQRRSRTLAGAVLAAALIAGCSAGDGEDRSTEPATSVPGPTIGLADEVPASLAFVDRSVAPSTGTIAAHADAVGVHSAPDPLFTRLGEIDAGTTVGLTGNRADADGDGDAWAEIIWADGTAWIPTSALAS